MDKKDILEKLSRIDKRAFFIEEIGLFGSYAKNEATEDSDIDILVKMEFKKGMYHNFCRLHEFLEELLGKKVDLIEKGTFNYKFKNPEVKEYKDKVKEQILGSVIYV